MNYNSLFCLLGLSSGIYFAVNGFYAGYIILTIIGIALSLCYKRFVFCLSLIFMFVGGLLTYNYLDISEKPLYNFINEKDTYGKFTVNEVIKETSSYTTLEVVINEINDIKCNDKMELYYYGDNVPGVNHICEFKKLNINIYEKKYFLTKASYRIFFSGTISQKNVKIIDKATNTPFVLLRNFREKVNLKIKNTFSYLTYPIIQALFTGNKSDIPVHLNEIFRESGTSHILSVSGMHVIIIIFILGLLFDKNKYLKYIKYIILIIFVLFSGASPSIIRATGLYFFSILAIKSRATSDSIHILCLLAIVSLITNPMLLYNKSFQLSYSAVYGVIAISQIFYFKSKYKFVDYFSKSAAVSLGAQIATIPFLVELNSEIGLFFITANIIVIFALPFVYMAGLLALISNIKIFAYICEVILHFIIFIATAFSNRKLPVIELNKSPAITGLLIFVCILIYIYALNYENRRIRAEIKDMYK